MRPQIVMLIPLGDAPVDPGFGGGIPGMRPDQGLPGHERPTDPGYGRPGVGAGHPDAGLPGQGGHPGHALPMPPVDPAWGTPAPPVDPGHGQGHPVGPRPGNELPDAPVTKPLPPTSPGQPGQIYPPIHGGIPGKSLALVWLVGHGYRWVVLGPQAPAQPKA
jgi:hypothetical protein